MNDKIRILKLKIIIKYNNFFWENKLQNYKIINWIYWKKINKKSRGKIKFLMGIEIKDKQFFIFLEYTSQKKN